MANSHSDDATADAALKHAAERIQRAGALGESRVRRLFDYLLATSLAGQSPKEIAIAMDVFGKGADFDVGNDALVRVYIHILRKALDEFYSSTGAKDELTIHIPRGEYRLRLNPKPAPPAEAVEAADEARRTPARKAPMVAAAVAGPLAATLGLVWATTAH